MTEMSSFPLRLPRSLKEELAKIANKQKKILSKYTAS